MTMESRGAARLVVPLVMLAVAMVGLVAVRVCACATSPTAVGEAEWREHLEAADAALAESNVSRATRVWQDARNAALRSGTWSVGARAEARGLYLRALFQARAQGSLDGVLRVTEAFASLGDQEVVDRGLSVARLLAARQGPAAWDRVREATIRLGARHSMAGRPETSL
jgi:hypothetical protein